ncbi:MAG: isochorismatase family protein [Gaiellales bacterium]
MIHAAEIWRDLLAEDDLHRIERAGFGRRVGLGQRPAMLVIDVQNYMVGDGQPSSDLEPVEYPSACGEPARRALSRIAALLDVARAHDVPVIYTVMQLRRDGADMGAYRRKRDLMQTEGWMLEGSVGAEVVADVAPRGSDMLLVKKKPSGFFGTPLLSLLVDRGIDSVIVVGGSTSNCVRATVVDAASYNFRVLVPHDCVFDRFDISHRVALFDIDRQYGDVTTSADVASCLNRQEG